MNPIRWPFYVQTLFAMAAGVALGILFGPKIAFLGVLGRVIIQVIKTFATPLLFFAILDSLLQAEFHGRGVAYMLLISAIDGVCAITIGLTLLNVFQPGSYLVTTGAAAASPTQKIDWAQGIASQLPESIAGPFVTNGIPAVIVLAILFGLAARSLERHPGDLPAHVFSTARETVRFLLHLNMRVIEWIVRFVPLAVFGAVAKAVGETGFAVLPGLGAYLVVCFVGMMLQVVIVYQAWIRLVAKIPLGQFWKAAREATLYAFGVNSSLATLPLTLKTLDTLKVSPASARLSACVGTNLNNDGILLYEVAAAIFVAQAHHVPLSIFQQLAVAVVCVLATIGVAGVPEAGFISLALVLSTVGLPAESLPLLLTVDWILARTRSFVNVVSDLTVAIGIDALSREAPDEIPAGNS